jgi:hypothetical protein
VKKKALWPVVVLPIFFVFLFLGCAAKPALKKELIQPAQLRVVTSCVPRVGVKVYHSGGEIAAIVAGVSGVGLGLAGPIADTSVKKWEAAVEREIYSAGVPRFYELVRAKFIEKVSREIPDWQPVVVDDEGVGPEVVKSLQRDPGPLLVLASGSSYSSPQNSCAPGLSTAHGLESKYSGRLYIQGRLVWEKYIKYESDHENRYRKIKEFSENNWGLLKEEMEYAADHIGGVLVEDLKREIRRAE